jgi:putative tryptophan/tyrosine transport system substrate-binding protein
MRRREFVLGGVMLACAGRASAQDRVRRVGALISEPYNVLETVLKENGWIVGRNLQIE